MIGYLLALTAAQAGAAPATQAAATADRVMVCYLRTATLSDAANPERFVPEGPHRLVAFRLPPASAEVIPGERVALHDPTNALLGRRIEHVMQPTGSPGASGSFGIMTRGTAEDILVLAIQAPAPGRAGGDSYLIRTQEGRGITYSLVGNCGVIPGDDPEGAFTFFQSQPGTRP